MAKIILANVMRPLRRPLKITFIIVAAFSLAGALCLILLNVAGSSQPSMNRETYTVGEITLLDECLSQYCKDFPPKFTGNQQLSETLMGNNSTKTVYLQSWSLPRNSSGELVDPWGDPFQFKQQGDVIVASSSHVPEQSYTRNWTPPK